MGSRGAPKTGGRKKGTPNKATAPFLITHVVPIVDQRARDAFPTAFGSAHLAARKAFYQCKRGGSRTAIKPVNVHSFAPRLTSELSSRSEGGHSFQKNGRGAASVK